MPKTIDSLQIEIKASATQAEKAIDSLCASLGNLQKSVNGSSFDKFTKSAQAVSSETKKLSISLSNIGNRTKVMTKSVGHANNIFKSSKGAVGLFSKSLKGLEKSAGSTSNVLEKLASKVGKFYNDIYLFQRLGNSLWSSIKSSMDYIEVLNYFEASFGQVAERAVSNFEEAGYNSAKEYYQSFKEQALRETKKLTGFMLTNNGTLENTGSKSLGLDPTETMNYQAQFAQMASSMGVASSTAVKLSDALTKIGADLASVKNLDFNQVWGDMASAMVGMSRTVDKYGVNIRNANMQTKLAELGINATVSSLSQADKALLRTIILLDSTKYAWGDLADTLNQPANQLRLISANFKNLTRMIGNLFLPVVARVLPYVNALVIALQRLVTLIGKFFGVNISALTQSVGGGGGSDALSDILDESDALGESLDDASGSAKKLKQNLMGVDELNIINEDQNNGGAGDLGGIGGLLDGAFDQALDDYIDAWNKAFDNLNNRAQELADKIAEFFKKLFSPIAKAWEIEGENVIESWRKAIKSLGELLKQIGSDFMDVWLEPETVRLFENLFHVIADIGQIVEALTTNFRTAWAEGERGKDIFRAIRDIAVVISESIRMVADYTVDWAKSLNFAPILESIKLLLQEIASIMPDVMSVLEHGYENFLEFAKYALEDALPRILDICRDLVHKINWKGLSDDLNKISDAFLEIKIVLVDWIINAFEKLKDIIVNFINGGYISKLADDFKNLADGLKNASSLGEVLNAIFDFGDERLSSFTELMSNIIQKVNEFVKNLNSVDPNTGETPIQTIGKRIGGMINSFFGNLDTASLGETISNFIVSLEDIIINALGEIDWIQVGEKIGDLLREIDWLKILGKLLQIIGQTLIGLIEARIGIALKAPLESAFLSLAGQLAFGTFALKIVNGICTALTGSGIIGNLTKGFKGLFEKSANQAMTEAGQTIVKTAKGGGWLSGLGTAISTAISVIASAGIGYKAGNGIGSFIDEELYGEFEGGKGYHKLFVETWKGVLDTFGQVGQDIAKGDKRWYEIGGEIIMGLAGGLLGTLETLLYIPVQIFNWFVDGVKSIFGIASPAKNVMFLGEYIMLGIIEGFVAKIGEWWTAIQNVFSNLCTWFEQTIIAPVKDFVGVQLKSHLDNFITNLVSFVETTKEKFAEWKDNVVEAIETFKTRASEKFAEWKRNTEETVSQWVTNVKTAVSQWATDVVSTLETWYTNATNAIKNWFGETKEKFERWKEEVTQIVETWKESIKQKFEEWKNDVVSKVEAFKVETGRKIEEFKANVENLIEQFKTNTRAKFEAWKADVTSIIERWKTEAQSKIEDFKNKAQSFIEEFKTRTEAKFNEWKASVISKVEEFRDKTVSAINNFKTKALEAIESFATNAKQRIEDFVAKTKAFFTEWKDKIVSTFEQLKQSAIEKCRNMVSGCKEWFESHHWNFDGIRQGLGQAFDSAIEWCKQKWEGFKGWLSNIGDSVRNLFDGGAMDVRRSSGYYYNGYSTYATGGFPEDGWFRASHGELIGQFDNGQSVVANNNQIIEGIQGGVERAVSSVLAPYLADIADNTRRTADKKNSVVIDGREIVSAYDSRKARNGFSFT